MHFKTRNVNTAFYTLVKGIHSGDIPTEVTTSRVGEVAQITEPVIITYEKPTERVLFNTVRDCNPAFHMMESLWMLAGRNDIAPLAYYSSNYAKQVQDGDCPTANGAYGHRWRCALGSHSQDHYEDQLEILIAHLKAKPESRRAVLQMWNVEDDLLKIDASRDVCCNLSVLFSVEDSGADLKQNGSPAPKYLNMTVFNRSNDLIWGALGANYVHFSILQEYVAAHLGVEVGAYHQVSNNLHVYTERFEAEKWLRAYDEISKTSHPDFCKAPYDLYRPAEDWSPYQLVKDPQRFDAELSEFVERHSKDAFAGVYTEPFLALVAQPMLVAFHHYKRGQLFEALDAARGIVADDWRVAMRGWIERRIERRNKRGNRSGAGAVAADNDQGADG